MRPVVAVQGEKKSVAMPAVFAAPLRSDLIRLVHTNMAKNKRQAVANMYESGYDTAAASWGTGRAVARIPRVPGGGTHRAGQAAFGNMCRGGGMFAPTKTWRRWHRKTNTTQKRHAVAASIAASGVPALVMARGHTVDEVPELPLVVSPKALEGCEKTKKAVSVLKDMGLAEELLKIQKSKKLRAGRGKCRNRRWTQKKGPLVVYDEEAEADNQDAITRGFRNIPGVDLASVNRLNLLQLAPGGNFGRLVMWTEAAFKKLNKVFGTHKSGSLLKKGYVLPRPQMTNCDIARIVNSNEVQSVVEVAKEPVKCFRQKKNALKNASVMGRVCPAANGLKKLRKSAHVKDTQVAKKIAKSKAAKAQFTAKHKKTGKAYYKDLLGAHPAGKFSIANGQEAEGEGEDEE
jgi:large subunit ribosomal protein L4e